MPPTFPRAGGELTHHSPLLDEAPGACRCLRRDATEVSSILEDDIWQQKHGGAVKRE